MKNLIKTEDIPIIVKVIKITQNIYTGVININGKNFDFHLETIVPFEYLKNVHHQNPKELTRFLYKIIIETNNGEKNICENIPLAIREYQFFFNLIVPNAKKISLKTEKITTLERQFSLGAISPFKKTNSIVESRYFNKIAIPSRIFSMVA